MVESFEGTPVKFQRIFFEKNELNDECTLAECGVNDGATLKLVGPSRCPMFQLPMFCGPCQYLSRAQICSCFKELLHDVQLLEESGYIHALNCSPIKVSCEGPPSNVCVKSFYNASRKVLSSHVSWHIAPTVCATAKGHFRPKSSVLLSLTFTNLCAQPC
eukprot:6205981-Pleurochrysis_carterae.AAC.1